MAEDKQPGQLYSAANAGNKHPVQKEFVTNILKITKGKLREGF
jgi:hypothetical protein